MSLPSYIINQDDLKQIIIQCINQTSLAISLENANITGAKLNVDTSNIEKGLTTLQESISTQSINTNQVYMDVNNLLVEMTGLQSMYQDHLTEITNIVIKTLAEKLKIKSLLENIRDILASNGKEKVISLNTAVAQIYGIYHLKYSVQNNLALKSIKVSQDSFDFNDYWELKINDEVIFESVYTKYVSEKKNLTAPINLFPSDVIDISFYNLSGNKKFINYDIEFLIV